MATFQKLTDVAVAEVVSEQANVFIEDGGELKRVAKSQVGGRGVSRLADFDDVVYIDVKLLDDIEFTCNKSFDDIVNLLLNHELSLITGTCYYSGRNHQTTIFVADCYLVSIAAGGEVFDESADYIVFIDAQGNDFYMDKTNHFEIGSPNVGNGPE